MVLLLLLYFGGNAATPPQEWSYLYSVRYCVKKKMVYNTIATCKQNSVHTKVETSTFKPIGSQQHMSLIYLITFFL